MSHLLRPSIDHNLANWAPRAVSPWQELIDLCRGQTPVVRATDREIVYELRIQGGVMRTELFLPARSLRLFIRCREDGTITVRDGHSRQTRR